MAKSPMPNIILFLSCRKSDIIYAGNIPENKVHFDTSAAVEESSVFFAYTLPVQLIMCIKYFKKSTICKKKCIRKI